jgi:hypothetical protein
MVRGRSLSFSPGTNNLIEAFSRAEGECGSSIGGKNDQRSCDCCRVAPRWHFAGSGTKRPCDWQRTASGGWRCGQSHSRCAVWCTVSSLRDEAPQKHVHVGKEPQRLKTEYHQVAISKSRFSGPGPLVSGAFFEFDFYRKKCGPLSPRSRQGLKHLVTIQRRKVFLIPSQPSDDCGARSQATDPRAMRRDGLR